MSVTEQKGFLLNALTALGDPTGFVFGPAADPQAYIKSDPAASDVVVHRISIPQVNTARGPQAALFSSEAGNAPRQLPVVQISPPPQRRACDSQVHPFIKQINQLRCCTSPRPMGAVPVSYERFPLAGLPSNLRSNYPAPGLKLPASEVTDVDVAKRVDWDRKCEEILKQKGLYPMSYHQYEQQILQAWRHEATLNQLNQTYYAQALAAQSAAQTTVPTPGQQAGDTPQPTADQGELIFDSTTDSGYGFDSVKFF